MPSFSSSSLLFLRMISCSLNCINEIFAKIRELGRNGSMVDLLHAFFPSSSDFLTDHRQLAAALAGYGCILLSSTQQIRHYRFHRSVWDILGNTVSLFGQVERNIIAHTVKLCKPY